MESQKLFTMRKQLLFALAMICQVAMGQSIWDACRLATVKEDLQEGVYATACHHLMSEATQLLGQQPVSVMMKDRTAASGDKHDYLSLSRYFWPDPTKPDGLPYVNRDGESNPELERLDRPRLSLMASGVTTLALAWYFSGDERYAMKAVEMLHCWFIDENTRMTPHLEYAQIVPGQNGDKGRCYGLIDSYPFVEMLDAVQVLEGCKSFTQRDRQALKAWFGSFLDWMLKSKQGQEESRQANNHSVAYDVQIMAYAKYVGNNEVLDSVLTAFYERRMKTQISADGSQPHELTRTLAFGYSEYNLSHMIDVLQIMRHTSHTTRSAETLTLCEKAADYLAAYLGKKAEEWPYQQISQWDEKQNQLAKDLYRLYLIDPQRTDYERMARKNMVKRWEDRFFLLYYTPDGIDNAFAHADSQLRHLLQRTDAMREEAGDTTLMPRSVERDGSLRMVRRTDWCCGFFSGELWQMYQYTHDPFWREQAARNTWRIEQAKWDASSHDLGFMVYNSFGKAYEQTGDEAYSDVVVQAAKTLATRFSPNVGCIRSWSWGTPERWQFAVIIDNMINLELLFEATRLTGDKRYHDMAVSHANMTRKRHFRSDGSSYHVVDYNPENGNVIKRMTQQGLFDESVWSRGQGWALYGYTMCYRYTHSPQDLAMAQKIAKFWFSQQDMPDDLIPYWDMRDPAIRTGKGPAQDGSVPRDASAAAVIASALYELSTYVDGKDADTYRRYADKIMHSLTTSYQSVLHTSQGFLLQHSTGNYPAHDEIDVPINYADYYYLEALNRAANVRLSE